LTFISASFCVIFFWIFAYDIGNLIYHNSDVGYFLRLLCPIALFTYIDDVVDVILKGLSKQVSVMIFNIVDLFTSITLIYFLLPIYGIYGYITVIFVSEILNFSISISALIKATKVNSY
jgi:stage V sporulation protein B